MEILSFDIKLSGTYWDKKPQCSVWFDDLLITTQEISNPQEIKFNQDVSEGEHCIKIRLENKSPYDTFKDEKGHIAKDMLLNIDDISIDNMSLGNLLWSAEYHLDEPQIYQSKKITELPHCVNLGWNGSYILRFSSPFYIWLLEKL